MPAESKHLLHKRKSSHRLNGIWHNWQNMSFKNYVVFRVKTYGIGFIGLILAGAGLIAVFLNNDIIVGAIMFLIGTIGVLYARYQWREHDIRLEQRKIGR